MLKPWSFLPESETGIFEGFRGSREVTARKLGADYPFQDAERRKWFNFFGRLMYGWRFRKA